MTNSQQATDQSAAKLYRGRNIPDRFSQPIGRYRGPDARADAEHWAIKEYVSKGRDAAVVTVTMDGDGSMDDNWSPGSYIFLDPAQA
jgi:hypothetical protein